MFLPNNAKLNVGVKIEVFSSAEAQAEGHPPEVIEFSETIEPNAELRGLIEALKKE